MTLRLIACVNADGCIDGFEPPKADIQRFQALTLGCPVIMGRKTWEALPRRPLPNRLNVVVTRSIDYACKLMDLMNELIQPAPIDLARNVDKWAGEGTAWVIGGGEVYAALIGHCEWLYVSHVKAKGGTVKFPPIRAGRYIQAALQRYDDHDLAIWRRVEK